MSSWAEAQSNDQCDPEESVRISAVCGVVMLHLSCLWVLRCCQMEKEVSYGIQTTNSQFRQATRVCNTHMTKEESCSERGCWILAHRSKESWQSLMCPSQFSLESLYLSSGKKIIENFHCGAFCTVGLRHRDEGVVLVKLPSVCVSVFMLELLTEVTLGLFLHSGDGTVLVCEEKLLELGHLVL